MPAIERTLAIVKPDAFDRCADIEKSILEKGFTIIQRLRKDLDKVEAEEFYAEHKGKPFFNNLVNYMTSGSSCVLILAAENGISGWRRALGPTKVSDATKEHPESLRAKFGDPTNDSHNALHGSDSTQSAEREIKFFFPNLTLEPVLTGEVAKQYLSHAVSPTLVQGLTQLAKTRPEDPIIWLADWLLVNNPNKPSAND